MIANTSCIQYNKTNSPSDKTQYWFFPILFSFLPFHLQRQQEGENKLSKTDNTREHVLGFLRYTDGDQDDENLYKMDWVSQSIDSNSTITNESLELSKSMIHKVRSRQAVSLYQWLFYLLSFRSVTHKSLEDLRWKRLAQQIIKFLLLQCRISCVSKVLVRYLSNISIIMCKRKGFPVP